MIELILCIVAVVLVIAFVAVAMVLAFKVVVQNNETIVHHRAKNGDVRLDEITEHYLKLTNLHSCIKK